MTIIATAKFDNDLSDLPSRLDPSRCRAEFVLTNWPFKGTWFAELGNAQSLYLTLKGEAVLTRHRIPVLQPLHVHGMESSQEEAYARAHMNQEPNPDDNSAALRASAEEDMVRAVLERVLSSGQATDKFSGWVLAAAGGFIGLQFSVAATVAPHAPVLMLTAILITVVSLFIGTMVRLMTYNVDHALAMQGIDKRGEEIRDRYVAEMTEQARYLKDEGKPVPPLRPLDFERISRNTTALVDLKQRRLPHMLFEAADKIIGLMVPKPVPATAVDRPFVDSDRPIRLATAAQYWAVVQLLVLIAAVAVGAIGYCVAALHSP
jgi:hypothetical protein